MDEFIHSLKSPCQQLVMKYGQGWLELDDESLGKWQQFQQCNSMIPQSFYKEW